MSHDKFNDPDKERIIPETYSALLIKTGQGHALWNPRHVVSGGGSVGDIGTISHGVFWKRWNVYNELPDGVSLLKRDVYRDGEPYDSGILQSGNGATITFDGTVSANPSAAPFGVPLPLSSVSVTPNLSSQQGNYAYLAPLQPARIDELSHPQVQDLSHWFYANNQHFRKGSVLVTAAVRAPGWLSGISISKSSSRSLKAGVNVPFFKAIIGGSKDTNEWDVIHKRSPTADSDVSDYTLILKFITKLNRTELAFYNIKSKFTAPTMPVLVDPRRGTATSIAPHAGWNERDGESPMLSPDTLIPGHTGLSTEHLTGEGHDQPSVDRIGSFGRDEGASHTTNIEAGPSMSSSVCSDDGARAGVVDVDGDPSAREDVVGSAPEEVDDNSDLSLLQHILASTLNDPDNREVNVVVGDWSLISDYQKTYNTTSDMSNMSTRISRPLDAKGNPTEVAFVTALELDNSYVRPHFAGLDITSEVWFPPWSTPCYTGDHSYIRIGTRISSVLGLLRYATSIVTFGVVDAGEQVAVKIMRRSDTIVPGQTTILMKELRRMGEELSILECLRHPNIQVLSGVWWPPQEPIPTLISKWEVNGDLSTHLDKLSRSSSEHDLWVTKLNLLQGILAGLVYLHSMHVVHANLKSENVLISPEGKPLLCDFGIAWTSIQMTTSGHCPYRYMAPELLDGWFYSRESDIWAYGCLALLVLADVKPYSNKGTDPHIVAALQRKELFPRPADMDNSHWALILSCCSFDVDARAKSDFVYDQLRVLQLLLRKDLAPQAWIFYDEYRTTLQRSKDAAEQEYEDRRRASRPGAAASHDLAKLAETCRSMIVKEMEKATEHLIRGLKERSLDHLLAPDMS